MYRTSRELRHLAGTTSHLSKAVLISRYINENMSKNEYDFISFLSCPKCEAHVEVYHKAEKTETKKPLASSTKPEV